MLYPLLFHPITKSKVWGSETWLLSGYGDDQSVVANGFLEGNSIGDLMEIYMDELVGGKVYDRYGSLFPLLFKMIDANDNLSVQVHPDDEQAAAMTSDGDTRQLGKTEMWVVTKAEKDASIILGFTRPTSSGEVQKSLSENTITDLLQVVPVRKYDVALIPAGTVHALCKGTQVAEIQETSDITYRLYDYNRPGLDGRLRELHIPQALQVLRYEAMPRPLLSVEDTRPVARLADDPHFTTNRLRFSGSLQRDYARYDSFVVYMCLEGETEIRYEDGSVTLTAGQTCLVPACLPDILLVAKGDCDIVETLIAN